jgi:hypothetical protein
MRKSLLIGVAAGIDLVAAYIFLRSGMVPIAGVLLAAAVVAGIFAFMQWRRGR